MLVSLPSFLSSLNRASKSPKPENRSKIVKPGESVLNQQEKLEKIPQRFRTGLQQLLLAKSL
jgi:hypothetical protein